MPFFLLEKKPEHLLVFLKLFVSKLWDFLHFLSVFQLAKVTSVVHVSSIFTFPSWKMLGNGKVWERGCHKIFPTFSTFLTLEFPGGICQMGIFPVKTVMGKNPNFPINCNNQRWRVWCTLSCDISRVPLIYTSWKFGPPCFISAC